MSDFAINRLNSPYLYEKQEFSSTTKEENTSVWQNQNPVNPEQKAKELGYKKTKYTNAYYDKKNKTYYKWNETSLSFDPVEHKILEAEKKGLSKTKNPNIFLNESTKQYFKWNGSQMTSQRINKMYESGIYTIGNDTRSLTYDTQGNCKLVEYNEVTYYKPGWHEKLSPAEIEEFEANLAGYIKTFKDGVYCDKTGKNFFAWNAEKNTFEQAEAPKMPSLEPELPITQEVKPPTLEETSAQKADGIIDNFEQSKVTGDCWLVSTIYGLSQNETGKELLKEIIQPDENGNVTINLKGANKSYTFTNAEIEEGMKSGKFANGDKDVAAIEMAVEKYRNELIDIRQKAREENIINPRGTSINPYRADYSRIYIDRPLESGLHITALALLTGKGSQHIMPSNDEGVHIVNHKYQLGGFNEETLQKYLNQPNQLIFASIKVEKEGHGVVVSSIDENYVHIVDPHDTSKTKPIPKNEFYENLIGITITDLKSAPEERLQYAGRLDTITPPEVKEYWDKQKEQEKE